MGNTMIFVVKHSFLLKMSDESIKIINVLEEEFLIFPVSSVHVHKFDLSFYDLEKEEDCLMTKVLTN